MIAFATVNIVKSMYHTIISTPRTRAAPQVTVTKDTMTHTATITTHPELEYEYQLFGNIRESMI